MRKKSKTKRGRLERNFPLRIVKLYIALFIVGFCTTLSAVNSYSQTAKVTLKLTNAKVELLFEEIEKHSDYVVLYKKNIVENKTVSVNSKNEYVEAVLSRVLPSLNLTYHINGNQIIVVENKKVPIEEVVEQNPTITASGTIVDPTGEPLPGVSVMEKGKSTNGTMTDVDGKFSLKVNVGAILEISYVGFEKQEVKAGADMKIVLKEKDTTFDDVVIVGYGVQKKVNLTGSISNVGSEVLENRPVSSAVSALQGTLPGVYITPSNGDPNQNMSFNVRGTTSINGGSPLVLIDGVEGSLKLLNPADIDNVTVLKDAAASSIYGVRAAFGVILITTKKGGKEGKTKVNYSGNVSFSQPTVFYEFVDNSWDHATFMNTALINSGITPLYPDVQMSGIKAYYDDPVNSPDYIIDANDNNKYYFVGYMDHKKNMIKSYAPKQVHNLSISGGNDKTTFYASASFTKQDGFLKMSNDEFSRWNTRLNVNHKFNNWANFGLKTIFNRSKNDEPYQYKSNNYFQQATFSSPLRGSYWHGDSRFPQYDKYIGWAFEDQNPADLLDRGGRKIDKNTEFIITPTIDLTPIKGFNIHADFTYRRFWSDIDEYRKKVGQQLTFNFVETGTAIIDDSYLEERRGTDYYAFNIFGDYSFKLQDKHNFKIMAGFNQESTKYKFTSAKSYNMLNIDMPSLSLATGKKEAGNAGYEFALRGAFGRFNYDFDGKYLFEANLRYDGTSRFPKDDRFLLVPSFSVGWRLTEEKFMEFSRSLFDNIKIRGSYGKLGNQMLSLSTWSDAQKYYPYIPFLSNGITSNYLSNGESVTYVDPALLVANTLTWETVSTIDAGLDLTLLKGRLDLVFDVYRRTTKDMLAARAFPEILGAQSPVVNFGELRTDGWELQVTWKDKIGEDINYSLGFNISDAQAKITKWDDSRILSGYYVGKKIGEIWGYETQGYFKDAADVAAHADQSFINSGVWTAGDIKYKDMDGNEKINNGDNTIDNPGDMKRIGNTTPRYSYGIRGDISYKGLFLNLFFQGIGKRDFFPTANEYWPVVTQYYNTQKWWFTDSWSESNTNAYFAKPRARDSRNRQSQTKYLEDGSYLRLKNLTVGYHLPQQWIKKIGLVNAQIYFSGENLLTFDNIKGYLDPESAANNGNAYYPFQRSYSFGVNLTF